MITRIIAKLDIKPPFVVKPIYFEGLKIVGNINNLAKKYYTQGVDEIFYIDIVASLYDRDILFDEVKKASKDVFVPFCVGGGVKSIDDFAKLFHSGADKVAINTYALQHNPGIINEASKIFGNQAVVINIEAKQIGSNWVCYSDGGKIKTNKDVIEWAKEVESRGAGEILLQSIDKDGSKDGFDIKLCEKVIDSVNIPVVVSSGAKDLDDIKNIIDIVKPSGVAISTLLHYDEVSIKDIKNYIKHKA